MRGNTFGKLFSLTTYGESHGHSMGVIIDGMLPGIDIDLKELQAFVDKRRPGKLKVSTDRNEKDLISVSSGIFEGKTLGTPIHVSIENTNQKSEDYKELKEQYRPGHADKTTLDKYGIRDHRGGGRASGRETVCRVIAGFFAKKIIDIPITSTITSIGKFQTKNRQLSPNSNLGISMDFDHKQIEDYLLDMKKNGQSCGGIIDVSIKNTPKALGEPCFDKLKADLAKAMLSIGSCIGFTICDATTTVKTLGTDVSIDSSYFGGMEGGISNGEEIHFKVYFKPPSTVGDKAKEGRHDPCILPRVRIVVESMAYIVLADHLLRQRAYLASKDFLK
ncbi:MAG: chorismate synthase [Bacteriovoracaceae bacterium]|jgi:chorismate synthase|nr:chorismate synthase [Bacteriovoracaceae bacterium]